MDIKSFLAEILPYFSALSIFDAGLLLIFIALFGWGFANGIIRAVGAVVSVFVAGLLAGRLYVLIGEWLSQFWEGFASGIGIMVVFVVTFLLIGKLFNFFVAIIDRVFDFLAFIPFLTTFKRLLGGFFGLLLGVLIIGFILYLSGRYIQWLWLMDAVQNSVVVPYLSKFNFLINIFFPEGIRNLTSYF
jgi:uncharacterized membrane protein required for colicin V production